MIILKFVFAFIILLHGLIHVMGFNKAFGYGNPSRLTKEISKPAGVCWLLAAFLFIVTTILFLCKMESWLIAGILALVISQVLIVTAWKDAKFGTVANIIILLVAIPTFAESNFNRMVKNETIALVSQVSSNKPIITKEMLKNLPPVVQKWLIHSGVVGKEKIQFVRLKQNGKMRTKPGSKWLPFTAKQYFTVDTPAFNWQASIQMMPLLTISGRDKFENGNGQMLIKVLSLINVVNAGGDTKMNESSMLRYMVETCWFPTAALADYFKWEAVDSLAAKATMNYKGITVSGIFQFNAMGDMISFTSERWYIIGKEATLEKWFVETKDFKVFEGIRIPCKSEVTWKLAGGDFTWLKLEIVDLEFYKPALYQ